MITQTVLSSEVFRLSNSSLIVVIEDFIQGVKWAAGYIWNICDSLILIICQIRRYAILLYKTSTQIHMEILIKTLWRQTSMNAV